MLNGKNTKNSYFLLSVASLYTPCFVLFCVFWYGPFCHGAHKLDLSTLFTTFCLCTSLPFISYIHNSWKCKQRLSTVWSMGTVFKIIILMCFTFKLTRRLYNVIIISVLWLQYRLHFLCFSDAKRSDERLKPLYMYISPCLCVKKNMGQFNSITKSRISYQRATCAQRHYWFGQ